MRRLVAVVSLLLAGATTLPSYAGAPALQVDRAAASRLVALVNATRAASGLARLAPDAQLTAEAERWTLHMATTGVLAHNDALFTTASHRAYRIRSFAENVGWNYTTATMHAAFLASPHHRDNLMGRDFRLLGIGAVSDGRGRLWVTEDFGTPRTAAAAPAPRVVAKPKPRLPVVAAPAATPRPRGEPTPTRPAVRRPAGEVVRQAATTAAVSPPPAHWVGACRGRL